MLDKAFDMIFKAALLIALLYALLMLVPFTVLVYRNVMQMHGCN